MRQCIIPRNVAGGEDLEAVYVCVCMIPGLTQFGRQGMVYGQLRSCKPYISLLCQRHNAIKKQGVLYLK